MKNSIKLNKQILILIVLFISLQSCKKSVDFIAFNGNIYTVNSDFNTASAFAVNDGKFVDIGNEEILSKYNTNQKIDLNGSTVLPGLIDAHCHFYGLGLNQSMIDLTGTNSFNEILEKISNKDNNIIRGRGWDQNDWKIKEFPNKEKLDLIYPNTPVILERIDGHAYLVNQKALDIAGIDINTKSTNGTLLSKKGKLTGVLIDGPMSLIDISFGEISLDDKIKALVSAQEICFKNGLTTVDDAGLSKDIIMLIDSLQKKELLKMRVYAMISNSENDVNYFIENGPIKTNSLNVRSVKVYGDGALGSRGATLKKPYSDDKHNYGKLVTSYKDIKDLANKLAEANFQMNTHAIGDSTINLLIDTYSKVLETKTDPRWRIEHSQIIDVNDIKGYNNKILPSVQPTHATSDMYWAEERVGSKRIKGAYAYKALLEKSKVIGLGTDFPVEKVNPFHTFYASVSRKDLNDYPEKGFEFENALSREETLKGMTIWAAYLNFEEKEKGSIEKGKFADFIIIDRDIMKVEINKTPETKVLKTYLSGELVYSKTKSN
ncbi:amidohydrolase [Flavobacteriaceae bacterium]|nr:amidohydrolase [Flavobacteriaceae bacterium]MDB4013484.1 amidohydrolase [Flavobacteriaceae bacterium]MDB4131582.1 amidohydrolase [Flavobacteriaceae bacterium]